MVRNEKLLEVMGGDLTQEQAFAHVNDVLKNEVGGDVRNGGDIIHIPSLAQVVFEDVIITARLPQAWSPPQPR